MCQVHKVPVRAHSSTLAENNNTTVTSPMTRRTADKLVTPLLSLLKLGDSFPAKVEDVIVDGEVEIPLISLNPPVHNNINDNYCTIDPPVTKPLEDQVLRQRTQTVNLNVVIPAPYVTEQSQKKDVSSHQVQKVIKCVNPVSHCLCAQNVGSVQYVVENPPVGGRLQKFWQVWLSQGSNPRVVSILKEGYCLYLPPLSRSPVVVTSKVDEVPSQQSDISIHCPSFWPVNGYVGVHPGSQVDGTGAG